MRRKRAAEGEEGWDDKGKRFSCPSRATLSSLLCPLDLQPWLPINAFGCYKKFREGLGLQRVNEAYDTLTQSTSLLRRPLRLLLLLEVEDDSPAYDSTNHSTTADATTTILPAPSFYQTASIHITHTHVYIHVSLSLTHTQRHSHSSLCNSDKNNNRSYQAMAGVVRRIKLGSQGLEVSAQGLGCMSMSGHYGPPKPDQDMITLIHHAIDAGVTLLDTADVYGPYTNEILLGKALKGGVRDKVELGTKFGSSSVDNKWVIRGDPAFVRAAIEGSLKRLGIDSVDLYYQHRIDTRVPIEVTVGELKKLVEEGKIKYIGLSEASASTIRRAHAVHPITAVQLEWSLWARDVEEDIIPTCRELGIGIVAYSPLGRGFFSSGANLVDNLANDDFRKYLPRFQAENLEHNKTIFDRVSDLAARKGCTPSQLALAWVHHQGNDVCPIPGTTKIENFNQNIGALSVKLTPEEMAELESYASADAVKGDRYMDGISTWKDSETPPLSSWKAA